MMLQRINHAIKPYWPIIQNHPFNQLLSTGTLPMPIFCNFLKHDKVYLFKFAECLNHVAKRATQPKHKEILFCLSRQIFKTHEKLHDKYLMMTPYLIGFFSHNPNKQLSNETVNQYLQHIHDATHSECIPLPVAIASLIPCFYIYSNLGRTMQQKKMNSNNPYQLWIDSYSNPAYLLANELILSVLDELIPLEMHSQYAPLAIDVFLESVRYEISLWDSVLPKQSTLFIPSRNI